jgi:hypothetical protein
MSQSFDTSETIKQIKESFPQITDIEKIKAFSQLAQIRGTEGASAIMDLLHQYANSGTLPQSIMWSLGTVREHADIYFPALLNYASIPMLGNRIYALCAIYLSCKWLSSDRLESHFDAMMTHYQSLKNQWGQKDNYADKYYQIYHLLEILGYFPKLEVETELYSALDLYSEAGLKYQAISSLWRLGKPVDDKYILDLIANDSMRWTMFWRLQEHGKLSLFPEQYRTAESFGRACIVSTMDAMYGAVDELKFIKKIRIHSQHKEYDGEYYIYNIYSNFGNYDEKFWAGAWVGPFSEKFDYSKMEMLQHILHRPGIIVEGWDNNSPETHIRDYLKFHRPIINNDIINPNCPTRDDL